MHPNPIEDHFPDPKTIQEPFKSKVALEPVFEILLGCLLDYFWGPFWGPFWDQIGPRRGQDEPKRAIKSFKGPKSNLFKNIKKPSVFEGFWGPEAFQESHQDPQRPKKLHLQKP